MRATDIPPKFAEIFAQNAGTPTFKRPIPQTTGDPNVASLDLGFPPNTAVPIASGGTPPNIADFNGILNQISAWCQWQSAGGPLYYDATFSGEIGGYPKGAVLSATTLGVGHFWISTVDNNGTNPDTGGANWTAFTFVGLAPLASPAFTGTPTAPTPGGGDNSTKIATTAFVQSALAAILAAAKAYSDAGDAALSASLGPQVKAWVRFVGRATAGACTILGALNVVSVTADNSANYTVVLANGISFSVGYCLTQCSLSLDSSVHVNMYPPDTGLPFVAGGSYIFHAVANTGSGGANPQNAYIEFK